MPPRTSASLATGNRGRYQFNRAAVEAFRINREAGPGRVTARRLNRVEYNNPIRDLLGVHLRPADEFPVDDSGYGFDNIGDVLSISPLLMEKYTAAAKKFRALPSVAKPFPSW